MPKLGDVHINPDTGLAVVYGPDPWAWDVLAYCWFSLDAYIKEKGEIPPYVSPSDRKALGL